MKYRIFLNKHPSTESHFSMSTPLNMHSTFSTEEEISKDIKVFSPLILYFITISVADAYSHAHQLYLSLTIVSFLLQLFFEN